MYSNLARVFPSKENQTFPLVLAKQNFPTAHVGHQKDGIIRIEPHSGTVEVALIQRGGTGPASPFVAIGIGEIAKKAVEAMRQIYNIHGAALALSRASEGLKDPGAIAARIAAGTYSTAAGSLNYRNTQLRFPECRKGLKFVRLDVEEQGLYWRYDREQSWKKLGGKIADQLVQLLLADLS